MKKSQRHTQKMRLHRETLRNLAAQDLDDVRGGTSTNCTGDPTVGDLCSVDPCGRIPK
jgi:hypothetical protein